MRKNSGTLETDLKTEEKGSLPTVDLPRKKDDESLVRFRLMQRPLLMQISKVADGGGAPELGHREEEEGKRGKERRALGPYL